MVTAAIRAAQRSIGMMRTVFFSLFPCLSENKEMSYIMRSFRKMFRFSSEASIQSSIIFSSSTEVIPLKYLYNSSWFIVNNLFLF